jgi:hypothetical protein
MSEKKEFIDIEDNECTFQGKVLADPQFSGDYAFLTLRCTTGELGANGQWTDTPMEVPLMTSIQGHVRTLQNHVQAGRRLKANCYYKAWTDGQDAHHHAFVIKSMKLGGKPYDGPKGGGSKPSVPPANVG